MAGVVGRGWEGMGLQVRSAVVQGLWQEQTEGGGSEHRGQGSRTMEVGGLAPHQPSFGFWDGWQCQERLWS